MHRLSSSLREVGLETTLHQASLMARRLGVTRVTDTTRLDKIGIPVFAAIRPSARQGSLCVHSGKGVYPMEAKVGALMEAIEFAMAEPGRAICPVFSSTLQRIEEAYNGTLGIADFCPKYGARFKSDEPILAVRALNLNDGKRYPVPAELVFMPFPMEYRGGKLGASTNGLASGNTFNEAVLHGVFEVMERDATSFNNIRDRSALVLYAETSDVLSGLVDKIAKADLRLFLRYTRSEFGCHHFSAAIVENDVRHAVAVACGAGLHLNKEIAAVRAITEAAQSRLTHIHGGRDDIVKRGEYFAEKGRAAEVEATTKLLRLCSNSAEVIAYADIESEEGSQTIDAALLSVRSRLLASSIEYILVVELATAADGLHVVKVIVPQLEMFEHELRKVGPRIARYVGSF